MVCGDGRILSLMRAARTHGLFHPAATPAEALAG